MSVETKIYLIEYLREGETSWYETADFFAEDAYEAIEKLQKQVPGANVQNVYLQLNGKWNRDE